MLRRMAAFTAAANLFPLLFVQWYEAIRDHEVELAAQLGAVVDELQAIYQVGLGTRRVRRRSRAA